MRRRHFAALATVLFVSLLSVSVEAQGKALHQRSYTLTITSPPDRITIPSRFLGLSFETKDILPGRTEAYPYFRSNNSSLIRLFRTLGVRSLRIGGNTADRLSIPVPDHRDIDELFGFAKAAHVKVIYTLRLNGSSPSKDASTAKYIMDHYPRDVSCLVVGNEPDVYEKHYTRYRTAIAAHFAAILAPGVDPHALFCGPSTTPGHPDWSNHFVSDFGPSGHILWITQHSYPGGNGKKITNPSKERERLLSPSFTRQYQKLADSFVPTVERAHLKYRIEETNSFYDGGAKGVSNTFASSLWALNYLYWWMQHRAQGVNFHTGDFVAAGPMQTICWYGIFHTQKGGHYQIRPIAYAMKAFDMTAHGALLSVHGLPRASSLKGYATANRASNTLFVTLVDSEYGPTAEPVAITLSTEVRRGRFATMQLTAPHSNVAATTGVTLGGSAIQSNGSWHGKWAKHSFRNHRIMLTLQPASAVIVKLPLN